MLWNAVMFWVGALVDSHSGIRRLELGSRKRGFIRRLIDKLPFSTEFELLLLKGGLFGGLWYTGSEWWHYAIGGGVMALAGIGNTMEWWQRLIQLLQDLIDHWRNRPEQ